MDLGSRGIVLSVNNYRVSKPTKKDINEYTEFLRKK